MAVDDKGVVAHSAERFGVPIIALSYVLAFAATVGESANKVGWGVTSVLICTVCVGWAVYVWVARRRSALHSAHRVPRFGTFVRVGAMTAAVVSTLPLVYIAVAGNETYSIPVVVIKIANNTSASATVYPYADFFLSQVETPLSDRVVQTGRLKLRPRDNETEFTIPARQWRAYEGQFRNEAALAPLLARGDLKLAVVVKTNRGLVTPHDLPFETRDFDEFWIEISID